MSSAADGDGAVGPGAMTVGESAAVVGWRRIVLGAAPVLLGGVLCGSDVPLMAVLMVMPSFLLYVSRRLSGGLRRVDRATGLARMFTASQLVCSSTLACLALRVMELRGAYPQLRAPVLLLSVLIVVPLSLWLAPRELDDVLAQEPIA